MMTKPTGKLLFAYNTIASLNERIADLKESIDFQTNLNSGLTMENERKLNEWNKCLAKITELGKGYEQLRIAALNAVCKIGGGQAKADLRDAYDKATEQLEALKEQTNE
jgi:hypothetical protein